MRERDELETDAPGGVAIPDEDLAAVALETMDNAYAPYSGFRVAAAVATDTGHIFTGVNVENASYGLTVCAERVAVFKAVSEGYDRIVKIAVVSSSGQKTYPCGACRQVLNEFSQEMSVVIADGSGRTERIRLADLLPRPFGPRSLA